MGTFSLTHAAKNDLRGIARFTEKRWGSAQRRHYLKGLDEAFVMLADAPKLGNACDYIDPGLRKYAFQRHVIFYDLLSNNQIQVIRVLHRNMDVHQAVFPS